MLAKDIMTKRLVTVHPDAAIEDIARRLLEAGISAMPVVDTQGELQGIVSEGDLIRRAEIDTDKRLSRWSALFLQPQEKAARYVKSHGRHARDIMTSDVICVAEDTPLAEVAELMERNRIKRVPVLRDGKLVGILSRANLLQGLAVLKPVKPIDADDEVIRDQILEALDVEAGVSTSTVNVIVERGVVHLWGAVSSDAERNAVVVSAENTPGVKKIVNNLGLVPRHIGFGGA